MNPAIRKKQKKIVEGINTYNLSKVPALSNVWTSLEFVAKDKNKVAVGGVLSGIVYWNGLEIKILWVKKEYRNKGLGSRLLRHVESIAISKGATVSMVDTFDFQAEEFYIKNEYKEIGKIDNFPEGHQRIYFSKRLDTK